MIMCFSFYDRYYNSKAKVMSHKTLSSHFLPHQISIERDNQKKEFSDSTAAFSRRN